MLLSLYKLLIRIMRVSHYLYCAILIIPFICSGCIKHPSFTSEQRPQHWGTLINKDHNLYQISPFLYRSEQPLKEQSERLKSIGIDSIITLRSRNKTATELQNQPFKIIHVPIHTWALDREDVLKTMQHIKQAQADQKKVLIHCYHGSDRTGTMIAMYRILFENWSIEDATQEMKYGNYGFHPIWINIDKLFTTENINWIRNHLD